MVSKKVLVMGGLLLLLLSVGVWTVSGQDGETGPFEEVPISTSATNSVGIGSYVAAEAYAVSAGADPVEQPVQALILPYSIYPGMGLQSIDEFVQPDPLIEGFTFEWSLTAPEGSSAELITGQVAIFMADVQGEYDLTLTVMDADGNSGEATWKVYASTYIGVGGLSSDPPAYPQCGTCHQDKGKAWYNTGHATFFTRAIDGEASDHYGPNCISCHTTGFNNRPEAVNGGFDDVAAEEGWTFPAELQPGNWAAMLQDFPKSAAMTNIQCESCHGPGNLHVTQGQGQEDKMIGLGLAEGTCAQCHGEEPYHVFPQEWELSGHAAKGAQAFWYPVGEDHAACVGCHSGAGFIDTVNGVPPEERRTNYQVITCAVCHDPHDAANPNQLRVFDSVTLPNGTEVASAGPAATCMTCHNARTDAVSVVEGENFSTPHYSTAAELMNSTGGYTWGETLPSTPHGIIIQGTCVTCHMAATPGMDDNGTPDDASDDTPLPGHQTVGEHTFAMVSPVDGTENVTVCAQCHGQLESFAFSAAADYDGDGETETNQDEIAGLQDVLKGALENSGVTVLDSYPYFQLPENPGVDIKGAVYNLKFSQSGGSAVHNFKYTVSLLQLSYEKLAGEPVPGATLIK